MKGGRQKSDERGFALLLVFLLAAAIALMLYQQVPRVAFESQREKEQLLIDRGEQYKRGIQMYFVQFKKYPSKIEDLENTNNQRFLRRHYIDPMTGKDDWRLIHVNGAGQLTDSLVTPLTNPAAASGASGASGASNSGTFSPGAFSMTSNDGASGEPQVNPAVLQRPSDRPLVTGAPGSETPTNVDPNDPKYWPPITLSSSGASGATGQPGAAPVPGQQQFPGQMPVPGQTLSPGQTAISGQTQIPGQPAIPGMPPGYQPGVTGASSTSPAPGQPGFNPQNPNQQPFPIPGMTPGQAQQQQQAPGGLAGVQQQIQTGLTNPQPGSTNAMGAGGLAGVASAFKGPSIKIYKGKQKYQEWEFIFDLKSLMPAGGQTGAPAQTPAANGQNTTQTPTPGAPPSPNPNQQ